MKSFRKPTALDETAHSLSLQDGNQLSSNVGQISSKGWVRPGVLIEPPPLPAMITAIRPPTALSCT